MSAEVRRLNLLRAARAQLEAQVEADRADRGGREALAEVDAELAELEPVVRAMPGTTYLFPQRRRRR